VQGRPGRQEPRWSDRTPPAEKLLYAKVCEAVDPRLAVLPQVMMTVPEGGRLAEAEADLVIVDPDHGVTVVEVKGGTLQYRAASGEWKRREAGARTIRDPVQQAKKARSIVRAALKQAQLPTEEIAFRWAVAVPECTLQTPGEALLPQALIWDARDLPDVAAALRRVQGPLVDREQPLGERRARLVARTLLGRDAAGLASDAAAVADHDDRVRALTASHRTVVHAFLAHRRVVVRGAAGTGKTVLAVELAALLASQGERVLLTCWHRLLAVHLRRWLQARLAEIGSPAAAAVTGDPTGQVVVADLVSLAGGGEPPQGADPRSWYVEHVPEQLTAGRTGGPFDAVVLDEAQDAGDLWLLALAGVLRDGGRFAAFSDRQQDLFGAGAAALEDVVQVDHELRENFRNSTQIADFARLFGELPTDCLTGDGPPVRFVRVPRDRVVGRVGEIARRLVRDEGFRPADVAALWLYHNPWRGDPGGLIAQDEAGQVITTNTAAFKGLERPVVVLGLDLREDRTAAEQQRNLYAAATRARSLLVVVGDPDQLRDRELYMVAALFKQAEPAPPEQADTAPG
jgi:hypothetical protein